MKGRVRRCTIEGTVPEIKTKNYISYLETFLIWFCEKEQHKEGERQMVRGGRADSSRTVHGGRADGARIVQMTRGRHTNSADGARTTSRRRADGEWTTSGR